MANNNKTEYDRIKATDTMEFYKIYDLWMKDIERKKDHLNQLKNKNNGRR